MRVRWLAMSLALTSCSRDLEGPPPEFETQVTEEAYTVEVFYDDLVDAYCDFHVECNDQEMVVRWETLEDCRAEVHRGAPRRDEWFFGSGSECRPKSSDIDDLKACFDDYRRGIATVMSQCAGNSSWLGPMPIRHFDECTPLCLPSFADDETWF